MQKNNLRIRLVLKFPARRNADPFKRVNLMCVTQGIIRSTKLNAFGLSEFTYSRMYGFIHLDIYLLIRIKNLFKKASELHRHYDPRFTGLHATAKDWKIEEREKQ